MTSFAKVKYCDDKDIIDNFNAAKANLGQLISCAKETDQANLGFSKSRNLIYILDDEINNKIFYFSFPMIHEIDFFLYREGELIEKKSYSKLNNQGSEYVYFDNLDRGNRTILALTNTQTSKQLPYLLFDTRDKFQSFLKERWIFDGLWFGVIFFTFVITVSFFFIRKKKEIVYYSMHIIALFVIQLAFSGYLFSTFGFLPDYFLHRAVVFSCGILTFGTVGLIYNTFIQQKQADKIIKAYGWVMGLAVIHFIACVLFYNQMIIKFTSYLTLVLSISSILVCSYAILRRLKHSASFLLSFSLFLFSSLAFTLKDLGVMNINEIQANYLVKMSLLIEIFILGAVMVRTLFEEAKIITNASMHQMITQGNIKIIKKLQHDINSPVISLEYFFSEAKKYLPEALRDSGRQSMNRIQDIINTLKINEEESILEEKAKKEVLAIYPLLKRIISEKRSEYKNRSDVQISLDLTADKDHFVHIRRSDFERTLSNIINNSVEAKKPQTNISIRVHVVFNDGKVEVIISDNGKGIAKENLKKVFKYGFSFEKEKGSGIGLSQAKEYIESEGGQISIESSLEQGTTLKISLNEMEAPEWYPQEVVIRTKKAVIIDDDDSIHHMWQKRLSSIGIETLHFKSVIAFKDWIATNDKREFSYFFDYELIGSSLNGLDLISEYNLQERSILVTSHFTDKKVQFDCIRVGVKMIPKESVVNLHIQKSDQAMPSEIILIDDDEFTHMNWKRSANQNEVKYNGFYSVDEFLKSAEKFSFDTPIYIDSNLSDGLKGEVLSEDIYKLGFTELFLATGYSKNDTLSPYWIKEVRGKEFPCA